MYKFKDTSLTPRCGWVYYIEETSIIIEAETYDDLVEDVIHNYILNDLEVPTNIELLIQNAICEECPTGFCIGHTNKYYVDDIDVLNKDTEINLLKRKTKHKAVDLDTARERYDICLDCEYNIEHEDLGDVCSISKCFISQLINQDKIILDKIENNNYNNHPTNCWQKKGK